MRPFRFIRVVALLAALASLSACRTTPLNKQEAAEWYGKYAPMVRWVGYQGSDQQSHHFIARVMDEWTYIQISRGELKVDDERPFSKTSSAPFYYYVVDPSRNYQKIADKGSGEPGGAANRSQPIPSGTNRTPVTAGSGR